MAEEHILLARQPIYDASLNVIAYELLHRSFNADASEVRDGDEASSRVLLTAFGSVGIMNVTEGKPAFINFTPHLIINPPPFAPDHLIIEVLENVQVTPQVLDGLRRLRARGFRIALDDFQHHPSLEPLVELADIVKLDVLELGDVKLRAEVRQLRNYPLRLLGEKIETWEMFNHCVDLGFSYFQGYFLARPQLLRGRQTTVGKHAVVKLIAELAEPEVDTASLAGIVASDPILSFQVIKLVNSALYRPARPIETLKDAIVYLGLERVRGWCLLLAMSKVGRKPRELTRLALARARLCETLGRRMEHDGTARFFTMGILSTMDAHLDTELASALQQMTLSAEMLDALLRHSGSMGAILQTATGFEQGRLETVPWRALRGFGIDQKTIEDAYLDSLQWAGETLAALAEALPPASGR